jgi:CDP-4-dehydro-6-deoxyglucose reductase
LVLHIKKVQEGAFSQYWFEQAKPNDLLRLNGPLGSFFLRQHNPTIKHVVFLATGTGIAPIQAMLEQIEMQHLLGTSFETVRVYVGGKTDDEMYWTPSSSLSKHPAFHCSACLSRQAERTGAGIEHGYVQDVLANHVQHHGLPMDQTAVYACGSDRMIQSARACLTGLKHPKHLFYADAFVSTAL